MTVYLDTSVVLRVLLRQPDQLEEWLTWDEVYSSEILRLEARRVLDRLRLEMALDDEGLVRAREELTRLERTLGWIALSPPVIRRASMPMATIVKTLDAIHLASALLFRERRGADLLFATHDRQQALGARALGFDCTGVEAANP